MIASEHRTPRAFLLLLLAGVLIVSLVVPAATAGAQELQGKQEGPDVTLTLLHNNDGESALFERLVGDQPFAESRHSPRWRRTCNVREIGVATTYR